MIEVIQRLSTRRKKIFYILMAITLIGISVDTFFTIPITSYFGVEYNLYIVYGLISYKVIELGILYLIFYRRHLRKVLHHPASEHLEKFEKNAKRFFMLVPHGSTIFAMISYKLTANIYFFLLFMLIATLTLLLVRPNRAIDKISS